MQGVYDGLISCSLPKGILHQLYTSPKKHIPSEHQNLSPVQCHGAFWTEETLLRIEGRMVDLLDHGMNLFPDPSRMKLMYSSRLLVQQI